MSPTPPKGPPGGGVNNPFDSSDALRQQRRANGGGGNSGGGNGGEFGPGRADNWSERGPWSKFSHTFVDRFYEDSAKKRADVVKKNFRQLRNEARQVQKSGLEGEALQAAAAPIQMATRELLQQAWLNLIDSWGATLLWLNAHWFMNVVAGEKFFCKLGYEWLPRGGKAVPGQEAGGSVMGIGYSSLGMLEKALIVFLDIVLVVILLICLIIIGFLVYVVTHPVKATWEFSEGLFDFAVLVAEMIGIALK